MNNREPWLVTCRDFAGRPRSLQVFVRGSEVVVVAPPGEVAKLDAAEAEQFHFVFATAARMATPSAPNGTGPSEETGTASTVKQHRGGLPPAVATRPASPPCRGGTTTPIPGSAATPPRSENAQCR